MVNEVTYGLDGVSMFVWDVQKQVWVYIYSFDTLLYPIEIVFDDRFYRKVTYGTT